jgi:hypothetical protein
VTRREISAGEDSRAESKCRVERDDLGEGSQLLHLDRQYKPNDCVPRPLMVIKESISAGEVACRLRHHCREPLRYQLGIESLRINFGVVQAVSLSNVHVAR